MSRRDYEEERGLGSSHGGSTGFTVAVIVKYLALIFVVVIIAYVVLQILEVIQ